ncbi:family 10 glycosylhydrolase [Saccharopolyspora sp. HNM0983]|uniref:Family 10 glycosylhydrolase n=1 Tax=Saccharopolyspora montiporae TaxID=2781240 RepID=A0A929B9E5_9PSEU|nr:family 10 glycosylhydrolase [Saccharopolyspora sp. HNM0983]MBE9373467.1 family 10 glycosylhydrolase [Saccharopolyspora sp. HNM0983]
MTRMQRIRRIRSDLLALALASVAALLGVIGTGGAAAVEPTARMRGMWIASVHNTDWPAPSDDSVHEQREHYRRLLNEAADSGLNSVFVQVRPTADAFWPSPHEPWSQWLTGEQGRDPGYDPLRFLVEETHRRGMQFHAWFNPFRISTGDDPAQLVPEHPARQHPEWTFRYGGELYYDPGVPQVREFVTDAITHAVQNYDVDGVHLDDYFYPYPVEGAELPDRDTFARYGDGFDSIEQWRRSNVDRFVADLDARVHRSAPEAEFGVSPFGIWRNADSDPAGSPTSGMESYSDQYADTRKWVRRGWVDYIAPQLYWPLGHADADYAALVPWWSRTVSGTDVDLYIGQAAHRVGDPGWTDPGELSAHLTLNRDHPPVSGDVFFSATSLTTNAREAFERLVAEHYR